MVLLSTKLLFLFAMILPDSHFIYANKTTVLCYMVAWASKRVNQGKFTVKEADTQLCTHVVYAFMGLNQNTSEIQSIDPTIDLGVEGQLKQLKDLKRLNQKIKVLASIGGYNEGSIKFSEMARSSAKKTDFINSIIKFINDYELDGIDICWQFPGQRGGRVDDKRNFVNLLRELKAVFQPKGWLVTVHIIAKRYVIDLGYDVKSISEIADYINLAAVEYHGPWERTTGIMAPLKSQNGNNVEWMVDYILKKGAIPSKVLLGLPTYGHAYLVQEEIKQGHYLGLFSNQTFQSQWTNEGGVIAYNEVCNNLKIERGWIEEWDKNSTTPVAYNGRRFISYDNEKSLIEKAKLVKSQQLGGIMLWSLDMDDFQGLCHEKKYPLLTALTEFLNNQNESSKNGSLDEQNLSSSNNTSLVEQNLSSNNTNLVEQNLSSNNTSLVEQNLSSNNTSLVEQNQSSNNTSLEEDKQSENKAVNKEYGTFKFLCFSSALLNVIILPIEDIFN